MDRQEYEIDGQGRQNREYTSNYSSGDGVGAMIMFGIMAAAVLSVVIFG